MPSSTFWPQIQFPVHHFRMLLLAALAMSFVATQARGDLIVPGAPGRRPPVPRPQPRPGTPADPVVDMPKLGVRAPVVVVRGEKNLPPQIECRIVIPRKVLEDLLKVEDQVFTPPFEVKGTMVGDLPGTGTGDGRGTGDGTGGPLGGTPYWGTAIAAVLLAGAAAIVPLVWLRRRSIGKRGLAAGTAGVAAIAAALLGLYATSGSGTAVWADIPGPPGERQSTIQMEVGDGGPRVTLYVK